MDFRSDAVAATVRKLTDSSGSRVSDLTESGCVEVAGGRRLHVIVEVPALLVSMVCLCAVPVYMVCGLLKVLPTYVVTVLLFGNLCVLLVFRKVKCWVLSRRLAARRDSLLRIFTGLPRACVGLEDGNTFKKLKVVREDLGVCLFDRELQRLVIEGCSHRYVIYGKNVRTVEPVSSSGGTGALLEVKVAGHDLRIILSVAGQGPLASLTEAYARGKKAKSFASMLSLVLFGSYVLEG